MKSHQPSPLVGFDTVRRSYLFHASSIWLFTRSDLKTIVCPSTIFGVLNGLALSIRAAREDESTLSCSEILLRLPIIAFWVWINLLPFNIDNQRQPEAILEDQVNKPWRTMPSRRMTPKEAKLLMLCLYPVAVSISFWFGGLRQCLSLGLLGFSYNELRLADRNWLSRNAVNALGFCCFISGSLEVTLAESLDFTSKRHGHICWWLGLIAAVVFTTVQTQDMADQDGDRVRSRKTMPLTVGDATTRWFTAVLMLVWSIVCPMYWDLGAPVMLTFGGLGASVAICSVAFRSVEDDRRTFLLWNFWMAMLYAMPLISIKG